MAILLIRATDNLLPDGDGRVVTSGAGYVVQPEMNVPDDAQSITVSQNNLENVYNVLQGRPIMWLLGKLPLVTLFNPSGSRLSEPIGQNLYTETAVSGAPVQGNPGVDGLGTIIQGSLETSNVNVPEKVVNL